MSIDVKGRRRANFWGLISGIALCVLSAGSGSAADVFLCEELIRHMEKGGIDTGEANRSQHWRTYLDSIEIVAPNGQSEKDTISYRMGGEVDVGSALVATIRFVDNANNSGRAARTMPLRGRWLSPIPMSVNGVKSRCGNEVAENIPLNATVDFKYTLTNRDDVTSSKGKWQFVLYTVNRTVLQFAEYELKPVSTPKEKAERWLASAYENYLVLDKCADLYVASLPKSQYRTAMAAIEAEAKKRDINTDAIWKRVNEDSKSDLQLWSSFVASRASLSFEQRSNLRDLCASASRVLIGRAQELQPAGATPKKDF